MLGHALRRNHDGQTTTFTRYKSQLRPCVLANQDILLRNRQGPNAYAIFNNAKKVINLNNLPA